MEGCFSVLSVFVFFLEVAAVPEARGFRATFSLGGTIPEAAGSFGFVVRDLRGFFWGGGRSWRAVAGAALIVPPKEDPLP